MGRPRKLLSTKSDTSHLTKEQQEEKKVAEKIIKTGSEQLQLQPEWLRDETAKKEWDRLLNELMQVEIISNLDYNNLGAYCNAFSSFVEITKQMKGKKFTDKFETVPLVKLQTNYSDEMKKYANMLGLSIDSRLKMATLKLGGKKNTIESDFGDI